MLRATFLILDRPQSGRSRSPIPTLERRPLSLRAWAGPEVPEHLLDRPGAAGLEPLTTQFVKAYPLELWKVLPAAQPRILAPGQALVTLPYEPSALDAPAGASNPAPFHQIVFGSVPRSDPPRRFVQARAGPDPTAPCEVRSGPATGWREPGGG